MHPTVVAGLLSFGLRLLEPLSLGLYAKMGTAAQEGEGNHRDHQPSPLLGLFHTSSAPMPSYEIRPKHTLTSPGSNGRTEENFSLQILLWTRSPSKSHLESVDSPAIPEWIPESWLISPHFCRSVCSRLWPSHWRSLAVSRLCHDHLVVSSISMSMSLSGVLPQTMPEVQGRRRRMNSPPCSAATNRAAR